MRWLKKALGLAGRKAAEELCTKGYIAAREGRLDDAQRLYDDAVEADPTLSVAAFNAGQTALERYNRDAAGLDDATRRARLDQACGRLQQALVADDGHAPSWRALARVQERLGDLAAASTSWARVEATLVGGEADAAALNDARVEARRERARLKPAADLAAAVVRARELMAVPEVETADAASAVDALIAARDAAVVAGIPAAPSLSTLAGMLARRGRDPRARSLLDDAVAADPRDLDAMRNLATLCLADGDLAAALKASQAAYRLDPVDAGLVCNVGVCHLAIAATVNGDVARAEVARAREFIDLARQLAPKDAIVVRAVATLDAVVVD